jgi:cytosine/adenosine deaminase-related metal-dependent hydrolase
MASVRPAAFMGLASGLDVGASADLVLFQSNEGKIRVERTYKAGVVAQASSPVIRA